MRQYSTDAAVIEWETHQQWFLNSLKNQDRAILIGEVQQKPVGVLRYDVSEGKAVVSVYLVPGCAGKGYGTLLLKTGSEWLGKNYAHITTVEAKILAINIASRKAFEKAGYKLSAEEGNSLTYHLNLMESIS